MSNKGVVFVVPVSNEVTLRLVRGGRHGVDFDWKSTTSIIDIIIIQSCPAAGTRNDS
jgi:sporulation protein YlmC with PRC-barrel domain